MIIIDIIAALILAVFVSLLLTYSFRRRNPWENFAAFFMLLFLFIWAGGIWITPVGPPVMGFYWLSFLLIGVLSLLIIGSLLPVNETVVKLETEEEKKEEEKIAKGLSTFFWIIIAFLAGSIIARYILFPV